jgi:hypothetical protein
MEMMVIMLQMLQMLQMFWCNNAFTSCLLGAIMRLNKILRSSRRADKSAMGTVNRPLRGCAAGLGDPDSFFKVYNRPLQTLT